MEHATSTLVEGVSDASTHRSLTSYDADIHAWAIRQAELIRLGRLDELDSENLADEVEDVARRERKELISRLGLVFGHLLRWDHQPERRSVSRARAIREERRQVDDPFAEARTRRSRLPRMLDEAFQQSRVAALDETGLADVDVPDANPFSWDELVRRPIVRPEP